MLHSLIVYLRIVNMSYIRILETYIGNAVKMCLKNYLRTYVETYIYI